MRVIAASCSVSHEAVPKSCRVIDRSSSIVPATSLRTSSSANAYVRDNPSEPAPSRSDLCIRSSTCFSRLLSASLTEGRNWGRGCLARNTCSDANNETHMHETYKREYCVTPSISTLEIRSQAPYQFAALSRYSSDGFCSRNVLTNFP